MLHVKLFNIIKKYQASGDTHAAKQYQAQEDLRHVWIYGGHVHTSHL
jgi:hypothetical protein